MLLSDIEANGLLDTVDKFHCAVTNDYVSDEYIRYRPQDFIKYLEALEAAVARGEILVFHNGTKYDIPALDKLSRIYRNGKGFMVPWYQVVDTLVLTRLVFSNLKDTDVGLMKSGKLPSARFGSHSLEAWGYRLGEMKGEYLTLFKKQLEEEGEEYTAGLEWKYFNEIMMEYNVQDVVVTKRLFEHLMSQVFYFPNEEPEGELEYERFWRGAIQAVGLEHEAAWVLAKMERNGYPVNREMMQELYTELASRRSHLLVELVDTFGSWYQPKGGTEMFRHPRTGKPLPKYPKVKYPKTGSVYLKDGKTLAKGETMESAPWTPIEYVTFNPSSRDHIQKKLREAGWEPIEFTPSGAPKVDDEVLEHVQVDNPKAQKCIELIKEYLMIQKRIGQVAEGDNAWLRRIAEDGRIHGSINPNGAVTGRATHSSPNLGQVVGGRAPYGKECRSAFGAEHNQRNGVKESWIQVGVDASGLELRCLGHFMSPFDAGEYCDVILNGDIHTKNQEAAGLPTRDNAKTFIYGFLYGAGAAKIGLIVKGTAEDGKRLIKSFLEQTPAIANLREAIESTLIKDSKWVGGEQKVTWKRRWIRGLDGRKVHVRSPHAALNTLLQSAGALICKAWVVESIKICEARGFKHGWDGDFALMAWVHDEMQIACRSKKIATDIIDICQQAMRNVGDMFNFRCLLDTEGKMGGNWYDCH